MKFTKYFIMGGALALAVGAITPFIVACSNSSTTTSPTPPAVNYANSVGKLQNDYSVSKSKIDPNIYGNMTENNIDLLTENAYRHLIDGQNLLQEMKATNQGNSDAAVWLQSLIYTFELEIKAYDANARWLGSTGSYPLSHFRNYVVSYSNNASQSRDYKIINETDINNSIRRLNDLTTYLDTTQSNLKEGVMNGVMFSGVSYTLLMHDIIRNIGIGNLPETYQDFTNKTPNTGIPSIRNGAGLWFPYDTYQTARKDDTSEINKLPGSKLVQLDQELNTASINANKKFNEFMTYMLDGYATAIRTNNFGVSTDFLNDNKTVVENALTYKVYDNNGAESVVSYPRFALSQNDLNQKDIGLGFMPNKYYGKKLYEYFLKLSTSTDKKAIEIHEQGLLAVAQNLKQMEDIANIVSRIETGSDTADWTPTVKYTTDPFATAPADIKLNIRVGGVIDFKEFIKWLNSEQWFFGRGDIDVNTQIKDIFTYEQLTDQNDNLLQPVDIAKILKDNDYEKWRKDATAYKASTTYQNAYIGANESLHSYYEFKDASVATIKKYFNNVVTDYQIIPYPEADVAFEGVGAYSGSSSSFFENVDPYYGLQKWNVSTLSLHEAVPGHHFQDKYYVENKEDGALSFSYTAFAEGWGLFSEWLGVALGIYGTPSIDTNGLPNNDLPDFSNGALGFVPTDAEALKTFQNGVYKTHEEGNALQYFGYLNEQQLRAMRLAVDTGIHAGDGTYTAGTGYSLKDVRDYMGENSALGAGDIISESKRYLSYAGQATSYYTGKLVLQDLFDSYYNSVTNTGKTFTNQNYKDFFHYVLKNNDVPLAVLESYVTSNLNFSMGTVANPSSSYDWLQTVVNEVPNRLAGNTNNTNALYNTKKGEKYAADWIKSKLAYMGYEGNAVANPSRNPAPNVNDQNTTNYKPSGRVNVVTHNLTQQQILDDLKYNGYFDQNFSWVSNATTNSSQNIILNINSTNKNMSTPGDGSKEDLYIVSHYDTKNPLNQGVNDNSSGLATNLAIADYFKVNTNREKLDYDLHLVFAGAEEVGIQGTWAFTETYLTPEVIKQTNPRALNLDSVAGGDHLYIHSPNSESGVVGANSNPALRDELYKLSSDNQFMIHPQLDANGPKRGEVGDFSDHVPFYRKGIMSSYIESTNYFIDGQDGYDGYSQTINHEFWANTDGSLANLTQEQRVPIDGGDAVTVYIPSIDKSNNDNNWGKIWHTDFDTMAKLEQYFPGRIQQQMNAIYNLLIKWLA